MCREEQDDIPQYTYAGLAAVTHEVLIMSSNAIYVCCRCPKLIPVSAVRGYRTPTERGVHRVHIIRAEKKAKRMELTNNSNGESNGRKLTFFQFFFFFFRATHPSSGARMDAQPERPTTGVTASRNTENHDITIEAGPERRYPKGPHHALQEEEPPSKHCQVSAFGYTSASVSWCYMASTGEQLLR